MFNFGRTILKLPELGHYHQQKLQCVYGLQNSQSLYEYLSGVKNMTWKALGELNGVLHAPAAFVLRMLWPAINRIAVYIFPLSIPMEVSFSIGPVLNQNAIIQF
jgi:hypothetical protein